MGQDTTATAEDRNPAKLTKGLKSTPQPATLTFMNFPGSSAATAGSVTAGVASVDMSRAVLADLKGSKYPWVGKGVKALPLIEA